MNEPQQVVLLGQTFVLRSEASPEQVQRVTALVSRKLAEAAGGRSADSLHTALLALLNLAGEHLLLHDEHETALQGASQRLVRLLQRLDAECPAPVDGEAGAGAGPA